MEILPLILPALGKVAFSAENGGTVRFYGLGR
jgi:hypothetical protein